MSSLVQIEAQANSISSLPALIDRAASALVSARTSGELLEAKNIASVAYDAAKSAARIAKAKKAHDDVIGAVYRAQADAALIEARAKIKLADEYDAAQKRGEVAAIGDNLPSVPKENSKPTASDIGLSRKEIHEARILRDAEKQQPGVIEKTVADRVQSSQEPTKASIKKAAYKATGRIIDKKPDDIPDLLIQDELAEARNTIVDLSEEVTALQDRLDVAAMDATDEEKQQAQKTINDLRHQIKVLEAENDAIKSKRDSLMNENAQMRKQINYWRKKAEKAA